MPKIQSRWSRDNFIIPVDVVIPEFVNIDVALDVVQFQFVLGGLPVQSQPTESPAPPRTTGWVDGFWTTTSTGGLLASILVGPGGTVELPAGRYAAWLRVVDNPTVPVVAVDQLTIS